MEWRDLNLQLHLFIFNRYSLKIICKKLAKNGLSIPKGGGFYPDFCLVPRIFFCHTGLQAKPRQNITTPKGRGFSS